MVQSLKRRTLGNIGLTAAARVVTLALQLGANVVLARNLSSVDYGIVGFAQAFISFLALLSEFGLSSAAIQSPELTPAALHTGFTLRLLLGLGAFGVALVAAPLCAVMLGEPVVSDVMKLLAVGFLINALAFVPSVQILRALDYRKFVGAQLAGALMNAAVTVTMALHGYAYWSIVVAMIAATATSVVFLNAMVRRRLRLTVERESMAHYATFGGHLFLSSALTLLVMNLDNFVVGATQGLRTLGYYAFAFTWGAKLSETLGSVVNSVLFPTFATIQTDIPQLRAAFLKSLELVGFLAVGGYVTLFLVSEDFLVHLLGRGTGKWLPALTALQVLCLYGAVRALLEPVGSVVLALGGPNVLVRANLLAAVAEVALIYPALLAFGIEGVAAAVTISFASQYVVFFPALRRRLNLRMSDLAARLWLPLAAGVIVLAGVSPLASGGALGHGQVRFWASSLLCGVAYLAVYGLLSRGAAYRELFQVVTSR